MSDKKIRKLFVNRSLPVEVAELIDEIHSDTQLNNEHLSKSGIVGKALSEYKNKKLNKFNELYKTGGFVKDSGCLLAESEDCSVSANTAGKGEKSESADVTESPESVSKSINQNQTL